ncbi:hypothetical protein B0H16DRAFT_1794548 [Mycena metata]|uniref:Uncharacterized protein n=1 Tax=Mycena metata TaxID=1033252 RepID=A0AAD7JL55_9AGAR|nr:hypothetical protein B0H16DRAFT_1794548 [Mycena metata]
MGFFLFPAPRTQALGTGVLTFLASIYLLTSPAFFLISLSPLPPLRNVLTPPSFYSSTTNAAGQTLTSTVQVTNTLSAGSTITSTPNTRTSTGTNHTAAIAGGVVGGVAAVLLAGLVIWLLHRRARERRREAEFDGNFDPGRTTAGGHAGSGPGVGEKGGPTLPHINNGVLAAEEEDDGVGGRLAGSSIGGGVVTPFMAGVGAGAVGAYGAHHAGQQGQGHGYYADPQPGQGGYVYPGGYDGASEVPTSPTTTTSYYPTGSSAHLAPGGYPPSSGPGSSTGGSSSGAGAGYYPNPMSAKEREARGQGGLGVANPGPGMHMPMPHSQGQGGMPALPNPHSGSPGEGVLVHTDGGRVPEEGAGGQGMSEIPPTYDSIRT